jgi:hypothetical protein
MKEGVREERGGRERHGGGTVGEGVQREGREGNEKGK